MKKSMPTEVCLIIDSLRRARLRAGHKQITVARRMGVTGSMVSRWETYQQAPSLLRLIGWAKALGCELVVSPEGA